ncbi:hypothetical protein GPEL0_01f1250 [Geoanaerobacter pelophilus]|uniref:Uncharacterized protein n=1 Tax=Geoanaerobacter pelophilus TaxID=60036 RepID=A0ABQ0MGC8_9BACT|nr:hypothetical protein GPEL0_01f1250 [Geoanaerobacter pelophilus]
MPFLQIGVDPYVKGERREFFFSAPSSCNDGLENFSLYRRDS